MAAVNYTTLCGGNAISTLSGHVRGASTGTLTARSGSLREADSGVLLLDEIVELGLGRQAILLKVAGEKTFFPFSSGREIQSDFQLIAGAHCGM